MDSMRQGDGSTGHESAARFPNPLEVSIPPECEGWEDLYSYEMLFSEDRRTFDEGRFWFWDALHYAEPFHPFDAVYHRFLIAGFNQGSARLFVVPSSLGLEVRILNGYVYISGNSVTDAATVARRAELFAKRGAYCYEHWTAVETHWREKVEVELADIRALEVPELPELEDEALVVEGRGLGSSHALIVAYDRLLEGFDRICHYHLELANLGYGAYLAFYAVVRRNFPRLSDQTIAKMVAGIDVLVLRPDEELKRLARVAVELGVAAQVKAARSEQQLQSALSTSEAGARWLRDFDDTKQAWFHFSYGNGLYHHHRSWIDDLTLPIQVIGSYAEHLEAGEEIFRPYEAVKAERDRITDAYRELLADEARPAFDEALALARTVFPHIEDHNFYVDHYYHTLFWNKVREFGALLARHAFLADQEDVFFLRYDEVRAALEELRLQWSSGGAGRARGPSYWPPIVERRKSIYEAMRRWAPPPALGLAPEVVTEPVLIMHWGITAERVRDWLVSAGAADADTLRGAAGSSGVVEGVARVIHSVEQLREVEDGEVLVASCTSTSWTPVFGRIAAAVMDAGGVMCHAAIVAREYGLPAVLGTGSATKLIKTGDVIRVDADNGVVTIVSRA